jgi:energy-coupling factor transport system permease protein
MAARASRVSTAYLLTCAAIGVAGGALLAVGNWLSTALLATAPFVSVAIAGLWLLPAVIAMRLLERPLAALLVGLISGLVIVPFSGYGFLSIGSNLSWALFVELPFLVVGYRFWKTWQYYAGAVAIGIVYPITAWQFFDLASFPLGLQVVFFVVTTASTVAATAVGLLISDRLRAIGVARTARRRPTPTAPAPAPVVE